MPTHTSARLNLPYLAAGQLQKHVTLNEALTRLDALIQTAVISRKQKAQPADPVEGDLYILPEGATGPDWSSRQPGDLVRFEAQGWSLISPWKGWSSSFSICPRRSSGATATGPPCRSTRPAWPRT